MADRAVTSCIRGQRLVLQLYDSPKASPLLHRYRARFFFQRPVNYEPTLKRLRSRQPVPALHRRKKRQTGDGNRCVSHPCRYS